jgi:hypothetical protein
MRRPLLSLLFLLSLPACDLLSGTDKCGGDSLPYYDVQGVRFWAMQPGQQVQSGSTASVATLSLRLDLDVRYYSAAPAPAGRFLAAAMACDPAPPGFRGTTERIDSLVIRSRYDYDAQHPAGSSLNDILLVDNSTHSLAHHLQGGQKEPSQQLWLRLSAAPTRSATQEFVVRYRLTNGEVYTAATPAFRIQ